jgi:glycosyltransferase involved in cell wall biosynthesis
MRILHVLNDVTDRGNGIVNATVDIAIEQARQGHTVAIASAGGEYVELLRASDVAHIPFNQSRTPLNLPYAFFRFPGIVRGFGPDVVHAHMRTGLLLAAAWRKRFGFALVSHVHNVHERKSKLMGVAQRVIVVSDSVGEAMQSYGIPRAKIRVVLNRILGTPRLATQMAAEPAKLQHPAIVTVCGLYARKGVAELITAFSAMAGEFPAAHLYIVGDGPDANAFHAQAAETACAARIHFEGFQHNAQKYLRVADVFVLASRRESFALVLIEARHAGCAIIATTTDGNPQALDDGRAGMLVPKENPAALADALRTMLSDDTERRAWGQRAQEGMDAFTISRMVKELQAVYEELRSGEVSL